MDEQVAFSYIDDAKITSWVYMYYTYLDTFKTKPETFYDLLEATDYISATSKIKRYYLEKSKEESEYEQ